MSDVTLTAVRGQRCIFAVEILDTADAEVTTGTATQSYAGTDRADVLDTSLSATATAPTHSADGTWICDLAGTETDYDFVYGNITHDGTGVTVSFSIATIAQVATVNVADERTFKPGREGSTAFNIITVKQNFEGTFAAKILTNDSDLSRTSTPTISITGAATVTATNIGISQDGTCVHFDTPALSTTGEYTVLITAYTVDGDTIPMSGTLRVE